MRRSFRISIGIVAVLLLVSIFGLRSTLRYGFSAHDQPTRMEAMMAAMMRHYSAPADLREAKNPVPLTPEILAEGRAHFADHCATCHGNDGKGQTEIGPRFYPKVPDMTLQATQEQSDGELFGTIENGVRMTGMPGWGNGTAESGRATWTLVHFIRHLPKITPEELAEMEKLNPKSPQEYEEMKQEEQFLEGGENASPSPSSEHTHHH